MKTLLIVLALSSVCSAGSSHYCDDYWRGRPIARLDVSKMATGNRRYVSPYGGYTTRRQYTRRDYRAAKRRMVRARRNYNRNYYRKGLQW